MRPSTRWPCLFVCVVSLLMQFVPFRKSDAQRPLSPTETVDRYLAAKEAQRWVEAARYLDLNALQVKRDTMLKYAAEPRRVHHLTPEEFMKQDSSMPRAVAVVSGMERAHESRQRHRSKMPCCYRRISRCMALQRGSRGFRRVLPHGAPGEIATDISLLLQAAQISCSILL